MSERTRVVFDCNTLLQGLASPHGPAGRCVQLAFDAQIELFVSSFVLGELSDVVSRPTVIRKLGLVSDRVEAFIEAVEVSATVLEGFAELFHYERDPDDAHYVNLALAAGAELIVSRDRDLLELMAAPTHDAIEFRRRFPALRILDPVAFLRDFDARSGAG